MTFIGAEKVEERMGGGRGERMGTEREDDPFIPVDTERRMKNEGNSISKNIGF